MEENKANVWGTPSKNPQAVSETVNATVTKPSNTPIYLVVVLLVCVFVLLGLVFFLYFSQNAKNSNPTVATTKTSSIAATENTSTASLPSSTGSTSSNSSAYYKYSTNSGKYVTFDYPTGGIITILSNREDKTFTKALDISDIEIKIDTLTFGSSTTFGADECTQYTYDVSKPNVVSYVGPSYNASGTKIANVKSGTWDISSDKVVVVNKDKGYVLIASDKIDGKFLMLDNYNESTGLRATAGVYKNICNNISFTPKGLIQDTTASSYVGHRAFCGASGVSFTEAKKCVEVLDRFITSFKVK
ncbi:MAG: hypothetical protein WCK31_03120 [bacterium]